MDIYRKVEEIISKGFTEYSVADIDELSKLKLELGKDVSKREGEYLVAKQLYKKEKAIKYMELKTNKEYSTDSQTKEASYIENINLEDDMLSKEISFKSVKQFHADLQDVLIAVRLAAKTYDDDLRNEGA